MLDFEKNELLYHSLSSMGEYFPLSTYISPELVKTQLEEFENQWKVFNPSKPQCNRFGLSVTSLDGGLSGIPDLTSIAEYNNLNNTKLNEVDFNLTTEVFRKCTAIHDLLLPFSQSLGRTHFIKLHEGSFFPYHRDCYTKFDNTFRIFVPLYTSTPRDFIFLMGMRRVELYSGTPYFVNARIEHALASMDNNSISLIANIKLSFDSINILKSMAQSR